MTSLELGLAVLGCGGGDPVPVTAVLLRELGRAGKLPAVRALADLPPDGYVVPCGMLGSGKAMSEKIAGGHEFSAAIRAAETAGGVPATALIATEMAGITGSMILFAAAAHGVDVVDADLKGRAFPRLDQSSLVAAGHPPDMMALATPAGALATFSDLDPEGFERVARLFLRESGGWAALAYGPVRIGELRDRTVLGSFSTALTIGRSLQRAFSLDSPLLGPQIGGTTIAVGTVTEVLRQSAESASGLGSVWITDQPSGAEVRIEMENEFLHALVDGKPVAATPDIIVVVDRRASSIVRCDDLRNGMLVEVIRLDPPAFWQDPDRRAFLTEAAIGSRWPDE